MLNLEQVKQALLERYSPEFNVILKNNNKGIITITFINKNTNKVNLKFNENTGITTIAPREMAKDEYQFVIKPDLDIIKNILKNCNISKKEQWDMCNKCGDYEYCAGNYGTEKCTGYIPGDPWNDNE